MIINGKRRNLPIGIQDFESLRRDGYLYVDKTRYVFELVHRGKPYFLSRPRRFGKSLFLSTLRAYWEGKKELFEGLDIEQLEAEEEKNNPGHHAWEAYPVFYFDFNRDDFTRESALEVILEEHLSGWEKFYEISEASASFSVRFQKLIVKATRMTGRNAVVLVDEYDKAFLETSEMADLEEHNKAVFKGFFSTLKSYDHYLKFVFLTGVTKFSKASIFSDLNQLNDISIDPRYGEICGITEAEMQENLLPEIDATAAALQETREECLASLKQMYDGYRFHQNAVGVYNPFSLMNALDKKELSAYWFSTGTPTFLVNKLKAVDFDPKRFTDGSIYADAALLSDYRADNPDPVPLLFQSGYLTIKSYDADFRSYELGYPNDEVKYGFLKSLVPMLLYAEQEKNPLDIRQFGMDLKKGDSDSLRDRFTALFARLPYTTDDRPTENNFQNVVYIVFMLLGQFVHTEIHSAKGRADVIAETEDYVYIFEFKRDATADEALAQIEEQGYAAPYAADQRTLIKVGAAFDSRERTLSEWKAVREE